MGESRITGGKRFRGYTGGISIGKNDEVEEKESGERRD